MTDSPTLRIYYPIHFPFCWKLLECVGCLSIYPSRSNLHPSSLCSVPWRLSCVKGINQFLSLWLPTEFHKWGSLAEDNSRKIRPEHLFPGLLLEKFLFMGWTFLKRCSLLLGSTSMHASLSQ